MKKLVILGVSVLLFLCFSVVNVGAVSNSIGYTGIVPSEYQNTITIETNGTKKVYRNVKIIQYSKNYWVEFETLYGDVYKFNTGETQSIAIKHKKK